MEVEGRGLRRLRGNPERRLRAAAAAHPAARPLLPVWPQVVRCLRSGCLLPEGPGPGRLLSLRVVSGGTGAGLVLGHCLRHGSALAHCSGRQPGLAVEPLIRPPWLTNGG